MGSLNKRSGTAYMVAACTKLISLYVNGPLSQKKIMYVMADVYAALYHYCEVNYVSIPALRDARDEALRKIREDTKNAST